MYDFKSDFFGVVGSVIIFVSYIYPAAILVRQIMQLHLPERAGAVAKGNSV